MASETCPLILCLVIIFSVGNCMGQSSYLTRGNRVLHPNVRVMTVESDGSIMETWEPSFEQIVAIEKGMPLKGYDESFVSSNKVKRDLTAATEHEDANNSDDGTEVNRRLTKGREMLAGDVVVEILGFVEHDLAAVYNFDKEKLLLKYTEMFWHVNVQYKSLPSCNISFQINGITILPKELTEPWKKKVVIGNNDQVQPDNPGLDIFSKWLRKNMDSYPKFDIAFYSATYFWTGYAYIKAACWITDEKHWSTFVFKDDGHENYDLTSLVAHECGHVLGSNHDEDLAPNAPRNYTMSKSGRNYFFSELSDSAISNLIRSRETGCLRKIDEPSSNSGRIGRSMKKAKAKLTMDEQCKILYKDESAVAMEDSKCGPWQMKCKVTKSNGAWSWRSFIPQEGGPCVDPEGGFCFFHKYCILPRSLVKNVLTGLCLHVENLYHSESIVELKDCANPATQFDGFLVSDNAIQAFYVSVSEYELRDTCLDIDGKTDQVSVRICDKTRASQVWEKVPIEQGMFLLRNPDSQKCLKRGSGDKDVVGNAKCNPKGEGFRWKIDEIPFY